MKIESIVVKIASRCNINCTYCYMYNHEDKSYLKQPKFISEETTTAFVNRLLEHAIEDDVKIFNICLHGGEPLLLGKKRLLEFIEKFNVLKENNIGVDFTMQTNGLLINDDWCQTFKENKIGVGVSLDGPKEINDIYRVDHQNKGTFDRILKGINSLRKNNLPVGTLSVMNLHADPEYLYESFKNMEISNMDILFMDLNYDNYNSFMDEVNYTMSEWYIQLFDLWFNDPSKKISFRLFDNFIGNILGGNTSADMVGTAEKSVMVLETNGDMEPVDSLKICGESFTKRNYNVNDNKIIDLAQNDIIYLYYKSGTYVSRKCQACPILEICGGGYLTHRYSSANGFNNPSVYCDDLLRLITHIQNRVIDNLPDEILEATGMQKLTYENALQIIEETLPAVPEPEYTELLESFRKLEYEKVI
ncbi:hypothetical protein GCM10022217_03210 [Chryseobacterium ginsenosidimutans]|uniref:radical SAM protein n=1 Tax=Chryseobacterium ginsenosidimutans TaxID=687846 RepID=UPI0031DF627E